MNLECKLHLGCGGVYLGGYVNIDFIQSEEIKVDRLFDLSKPLTGYAPRSVSEILAIHVFEHLPRHGLEKVVKSWYDALKPGGLLLMEMPNFLALITQFIANNYGDKGDNDEVMEWMFGNQEHKGQYHHWGWYPDNIRKFLYEVGFKEIVTGEALLRASNKSICFRVEARK